MNICPRCNCTMTYRGVVLTGKNLGQLICTSCAGGLIVTLEELVRVLEQEEQGVREVRDYLKLKKYEPEPGQTFSQFVIQSFDELEEAWYESSRR
jgi:hypothetical protein